MKGYSAMSAFANQSRAQQALGCLLMAGLFSSVVFAEDSSGSPSSASDLSQGAAGVGSRDDFKQMISGFNVLKPLLIEFLGNTEFFKGLQSNVDKNCKPKWKEKSRECNEARTKKDFYNNTLLGNFDNIVIFGLAVGFVTYYRDKFKVIFTNSIFTMENFGLVLKALGGDQNATKAIADKANAFMESFFPPVSKDQSVVINPADSTKALVGCEQEKIKTESVEY
jgi:hypothetical protein